MPRVSRLTTGPVGAPAASVSTVQTKKFSNVPLDAQGRTARLSVVLPPDVMSVSIFVNGKKDSEYLVEHFDSNGQVLTDERPPGVRMPADEFTQNPFDAGPLRSPNRSVVGAFLGKAQFMAPNNPRVALGGGKAEFSVRGFGGSSTATVATPATGAVDIQVQIKRGPKNVVRGRLPLNLYFTGSGGYTAKTAAQSPIIKAALEKLTAAYAAAGIEVGPVTYNAVSPTFAKVSSGAQVQEMFESPAERKGVNLFFVNDLTAVGGTAVGASAGLPGPASNGSLRSGVLIATRDIPITFGSVESGSNALAGPMIHEVGHYLSLFHTADTFMRVEDQLADTSANDTHNVMFPSDTEAPSFSKDQAWVMLRHPAVENFNPR